MLKPCMHHLLLPISLLLVASSCGSSVSSSAGAAAPGSVPPFPVPGPGISGCVESADLKAYVLALEGHRQAARGAALAAQGVERDERRGLFAAAGAPDTLESTFEAGGKRFGVVAQIAPPFQPSVSLAKQGNELHRIDERPRAHPVPIVACGTNTCKPRAADRATPSPPKAPARAVVVELAPEESLGRALGLSYDFWWADVRYDRQRPCP